MNGIGTNGGGAARLARLLIGVAVPLTLVCALGVASAPAKQVYDYEYSGTFFDGSDSDEGAFPGTANLAYDRNRQKFLVAIGANPGYVSKFTSAGVADLFSGPGTDTTYVEEGAGTNTGSEVDIAVDQSGGPTDGNFYLAGDGFGASNTQHGFTPDGNPIPGFKQFNESLCGIAVDSQGRVVAAARQGLEHFSASGEPLFEVHPKVRALQTGATTLYSESGGGVCRPAIDSNGHFYVLRNDTNDKVHKLDAETGERIYELTQNTLSRGIAIDASNDDVFVLEGNQWFSQYDSTGAKLGGEWGMAGGGYEGLSGASRGLAVDPVTHDVWVANRRDYGSGVRHIEKFVRTGPITVPATTVQAPDLDDSIPADAALRGAIDPDGIETTDCHFEWGATEALGNSVPCAEGNEFSGSGNIPVSAAINGLSTGKRYWYRLSAKNGNERVFLSGPQEFIAQGTPVIEGPIVVDKVNTDGAQLNAQLKSNGGNTAYHFEVGTSEGEYSITTPDSVPFGFDVDTPQLDAQSVTGVITGLDPSTEYHFRIVVSNEAGTVFGEDRTFTTYAPDPTSDPCGNAEVRQQVEASLLLDCRAYELVSAVNSGGYDIVSDLVPGQMPYQAYPRASGRLLYSLHHGLIPGIAGSPTNFGRDPYVASRGETGWSTEYVGIPAVGLPDGDSYGSPLLAADPFLTAFAFGGQDICDPCFADGSTNVPLRRNGGTLIKGMAGSLNPAADPSGEMGRPFSDDGRHFVFGAEQRFEPSGAEGEVSIYDRNLDTNFTQVVSTLPNGTTMTGDVAQLDVSADGSRILVGKLVKTDGFGNRYFDLYMHIGSSPNSVEVADTPGGVLFNGMTADGTEVLFTTSDPIGADTDASADLFRAGVGTSGTATISRLSSGAEGSGNTDGCTPDENWNAAEGGPDCGVLAPAGGAGIAREGGTVYFFSPELLDGAENGVADEPNLYAVGPASTPKFVGTLEPGNVAIVNARENSEVHSYGDFQVSPNGDYAVFSSSIPLTGFGNLGHSEIYRYATGSGQLACPSCGSTGAQPTTDVALSAIGLNLADDGRVFFTTLESFALRDTNERRDVYEWSGGMTQLISTGTGGEDSGLLSASADGTDIFFFTRDTLVNGDENGNTVKVYTAHEGGGFLFDPPQFPCAASDECHGAGTQQPLPPDINTFEGAGLRAPAATSDQCVNLARRAKRNSNRAKRLRRIARRSSAAKRSRRARRRAVRAARIARNLSRRARACRRANRGNG